MKIDFKNGFTLLEVVVVVGILGILMVSTVGLFLSSVRGGNKVNVTTEVKQNGQLAINAFGQMTRNAIVLNSCSDDSVNLVARDGLALSFSCQDIGLDSGHIASGSARLTSDRMTVTSCKFTCDVDADGLRGSLVSLVFSARQANSGAGVAESTTVDFATSVYVRSN